MPTRRVMLGLSSAIFAIAWASACSSDQPGPAAQQSAATASQQAGAPPPPPSGPVLIADDLPPLPPGANNAARPTEIVKAAYEFAARHPDVLKYMPCFCSCPQMGHKSNEDCFVAGHDAKGQVNAWEYHGMGCEVCIDVAYQAMQMHNAGASTAAIRDAIDKKYDTYNRPHTPTPMPPRDSGDLQR